MFVLGIETSCDETAVSVVDSGKRICSNIVASSVEFHKRYRGVIPEIASRLQLETISTVFTDAIKQAKIKLGDIKLIAVTSHPGLLGSLLVGIYFAEGLSLARNIPLIKINHLYAHIYASFFNKEKPTFPFIGLVVSGGHTSLFYVKRFSKIRPLGSTQDDACGEAFDKVATMLGLGYPGGPIIERLARRGNPESITFRCSNTKNPLDFSFSGIKTAVLYYIKKQSTVQRRKSIKKNKYGLWTMDYGLICDIAASFQEKVIATLVKKSILACELNNTKQLVVGGGVAANERLRNRFIKQAKIKGINVYFSPKEFCTDNAVMVAGLGYWLYKREKKEGEKDG